MEGGSRFDGLAWRCGDGTSVKEDEKKTNSRQRGLYVLPSLHGIYPSAGSVEEDEVSFDAVDPCSDSCRYCQI